MNTPAGSPASAHSSAIQFAADGSFSLGLSTTALPATIAIGKNQHGTIAGKLNGLMIATTPSGWRIEVTSTRADDALGEVALQQLRHPARELHDLEPARDLAHRVAQHLAVLGGDDRRELLGALIEQVAEPEEDPRALRERRRAPRRERGARGVDRGVDLGRRRERDLLGHPAGRGIEHIASPLRRSVDELAVDPVGNEGHQTLSSLFVRPLLDQ